VNLHKHQMYLLKQHNEPYKLWSASIRINTEGKSLTMKLRPVYMERKVHTWTRVWGLI